MFHISKNGYITMSRGDTWSTQIFVNLGTELEPSGYALKENEYLYFGLMEPGQPFEFALIRKRFSAEDAVPDTVGYYNISFDYKDTQELLPGVYYYQVKLQRFDEDGRELVDTIISKTKFIIVD